MAKEQGFYSRVIKEIESWQREGLITSEQAKNLIARYSLPEAVSERSPLSKIITILSIFGSILVGVGIILFFASNWRGIPKPFKLILILISIFATYSIGYALSCDKKTYIKTGRAVILLGTILFGAGIFLVGQIYHFPANYPGGVLFWALGILPIGYILEFNPIIFLSSLLLILWNILRLTGLDQANYFYLIFFSLALYLSYRAKSTRLIFFNLLGLIIWFISYLIFWNFKVHAPFTNSILLFLNLGILLYILGRLHETSPSLNIFKNSYKFLGMFLLLLNSYYLTHDHAYYIPSYYLSKMVAVSKVMIMNFIILVFAMAALVFNIFQQKEKNRIALYEFYSLLIILLLSTFCLFMPQDLAGHYNKDKFLFYPFIFNFVLFFEILGIIVLGYLFREIYLVNLGIFFFPVHILTLYFSVFWKLLPRSLFFIIFGLILLLGGGYLEKKRKGLISKIKAGE